MIRSAPARATLLLAAAAALAAAQSNPRPVPGAGGGTNADRGSYETCPQQPTLRCKNGSTCEAGVANFGRHHDHLDLQTHEGGYYCKCLPGFIGHECGIQVDDCDGDTGYNPSDAKGVLRSCYHGAQCKSNGSGFYCDCKQLNMDTGPVAAKFAGLMCQHESTGLCAASLVGSHAPNGQFCTNHGQCVKMVAAGDPHPGCACTDGWMGDHCEVRVDPLSSIQPSQEPASATAGKVLFGLLVIAMGSVAIGIGYVLVKSKRKYGDDDAEGPKEEGTKKTVVGAGDLEPDGSGTLGKEAEGDEGDAASPDADGDLELTEEKEEKETSEAEEPEIV